MPQLRRPAPGQPLELVPDEPAAPPPVYVAGAGVTISRDAPGAPTQAAPAAAEPSLEVQRTQPGGELTWGQRIGGTAASLALPALGYLYGGPGGGSLGGQAGEAARQYIQGEPFNPELMAVEGALNLIPFGGAAASFGGNVAKRAAVSAAQGVAGDVARNLVTTGQLPSFGEAALSGGIGLATGGVLGAGEHIVIHRAAPGAPLQVTPAAAPEVPPAVSRETLQNAPGPPIAPEPALGTGAEPIARPAPTVGERQPSAFPRTHEESMQFLKSEDERMALWEKTPAELDALHAKAAAHEQQTMQEIFGDRAAEVERQQRKGTFDEDTLTPEQWYRVYQEAPFGSEEEIRDYRRALSDIESDAETPEALGHGLRYTITKLSGAPRDPAEMTYGQRIAYSQLRHAHDIAAQNGWDLQSISRAAVQGAAGRFADPADAEYMLGQFMKPRPQEAAPVAGRTLLEGATSPEAVPRVASQKAQGIRFFRQPVRGGEVTELPVDVAAVDIQPRGDEIIYKFQDGGVTIEKTGPDVAPGLKQGAQVRFERDLRQKLSQAPPPRPSLTGMPTAEEPLGITAPEAEGATARMRGLFGSERGSIPLAPGGKPPKPPGPPEQKPLPGMPEEEKPPSWMGFPLGRPPGGMKGEPGHGPVPPPLPGVERPAPPDVQGGRLSSDRPDELARSLNESLNLPEDIDKVQKQLALHIRENIEYARRGVVPQEETKRAAESMGMTLEDLSKRERGDIGNAAWTFAAQRLNQAQIGLFHEAWEKAHRTGSDADKLDMIQQLYTLFMTKQQTAGNAAEIGRAQNILNAIKKDRTMQAASQAFERMGGKENIDAIIEDLRKFSPNDAAAINRYVDTLARASNWDKAHEYFLASLVSGPQTHIAQAVGNMGFALERPAMKVFQVGADIIRSAVTHQPRQRFIGEVPADLAGMYRGIRGGVTGALRALTAEGAMQGKFDVPLKQAIGGRLGHWIRFPLRLLSAGDELFKSINVQGHLGALAYREAMREGRTGKAFTDRVAEIISRPESVEGIREQLEAEALYRVFQNRGGAFTQQLKGLRRSTKIGPFILPFIQTPVNVFKATVERSPFALVDILQRARAGTLAGANLSDEMTRAAMGTAIAAAAVLAVKEGAITGFGPVDPKERAAWRLTHQPYSAKIPEDMAKLLGIKSQWINYGRIEPWGTAIGWAADTGELMQHTEAEDAVTKAGFLIGKGLTSKTWMQGVSGFFNAIDDPKNYLQQFIQKFAGSVAVPNAIAQLSRSIDPVLRKPRTIAETIQSRLGAGGGIADFVKEVGPVRDVFGEPVIIAGGPIERAISPIYRSLTREEDPARAEVARLEIAPGSPQRQLSGIKMTPAEYDRYVAESGALAHKLIGRLVQSSGYKGLPDEVKEDAIHRVFIEARAAIRERTRPRVIRRGLSEGQKLKVGGR